MTTYLSFSPTSPNPKPSSGASWEAFKFFEETSRLWWDELLGARRIVGFKAIPKSRGAPTFCSNLRTASSASRTPPKLNVPIRFACAVAAAALASAALDAINFRIASPCRLITVGAAPRGFCNNFVTNESRNDEAGRVVKML